MPLYQIRSNGIATKKRCEGGYGIGIVCASASHVESRCFRPIPALHLRDLKHQTAPTARIPNLSLFLNTTCALQKRKTNANPNSIVLPQWRIAWHRRTHRYLTYYRTRKSTAETSPFTPNTSGKPSIPSLLARSPDSRPPRDNDKGWKHIHHRGDWGTGKPIPKRQAHKHKCTAAPSISHSRLSNAMSWLLLQ